MPVANPGGPYTMPRGSWITLDGTGSTQPDGSFANSGYEWQIGYDGVTFHPKISSPQVNIGVLGDFSPPTTTTLALRVRDNLGVYSAIATTTLHSAPTSDVAWRLPALWAWSASWTNRWASC